MDVFKILGRKEKLFIKDVDQHEKFLRETLAGSKVLIIGAAGSIGKAVCIEVFKRNPKVLHAVDISENNLVELVRTLRSTMGYIDGEFNTFAIDCGSVEYEHFFTSEGPYDYIFNLSALKHVRSESDPYTLMRMFNVNIINTLSTVQLASKYDCQKYFCVSTDKAANPVNLMGASKRIMENFLMSHNSRQIVSMARFANVAFSDGSLLHGFTQRFISKQPLTAPNDIRRYFITPDESGELCLLSALQGENRDIFFPKLESDVSLQYFSEIAVKFIEEMGFEPYVCNSEEYARANASKLIKEGKWPLYLFESDTTGEKPYEEFFMGHEVIDNERFTDIGVISHKAEHNEKLLDDFMNRINNLKAAGSWNKHDFIKICQDILPEFKHKDAGKNLIARM